jgi:hypothetical protein
MSAQTDPDGLSPRKLRFMRYWGFNMAMTRSWGWSSTPGFSYSDSEWSRLSALAATVPESSSAVWLAVCPIIFIIMAAVAVGGIMFPLAGVLWPDPSQTPAIGFVSLLAFTTFLTIGIGMPFAISWAGVIADWFGDAKPYLADGEDAALAAKVDRQLWRLMAVMCVLFIPGAMTLIVLNIDIRPVLLALKMVVGASIVIGMVSIHKSRGSG